MTQPQKLSPTTISAIDCELFYAFYTQLPTKSKSCVYACMVKGRKPVASEARTLKTFQGKRILFNEMLSVAIHGAVSDRVLRFKLASTPESTIRLRKIELIPREHTSTKDTHALREEDYVFLVNYVFKRKLDESAKRNVGNMFCSHPISENETLPAVKRRALKMRAIKYIGEYNDFVDFFNNLGIAISV